MATTQASGPPLAGLIAVRRASALAASSAGAGTPGPDLLVLAAIRAALAGPGAAGPLPGPDVLALLAIRLAALAGLPIDPIVRDWDIYDDIIAILRGTGQFGLVMASDGPELRGESAEVRSVAVVIPGPGDESDGFDDPAGPQWVRRVSWTLRVISRHKDPRHRDREAERLLSVARSALDFRSLGRGGATIPGLTKILKDSYRPAEPPERSVLAEGAFAYFIDGPQGRSTSR